MFRFADPQYLYLLLLLPLLIALRVGYGYHARSRSVRLADADLLDQMAPRRSRMRRGLKFSLVIGALAALIVMVARPQYGEKTVTQGKGGIEVCFMLDVSNSMLARDASPNRLDRARLLISNMLDRLEGSKVSFGVFAGQAVPQLPLTGDFNAARIQLDAVSPSMLTVQGTDLGEAITYGASLFSDREVGKALVVITDGEDHSQKAEEAAKKAHDNDVTLYVLGIGSTQGATIPLDDGPLTDKDGNVVKTCLNEDMCRRIAEVGEGLYLHVDNSNHAQETLLEAFRQLPQAEQEFQTTEAGEQYQAFGIIALLLLLVGVLVFEGKIPLYVRLGLFTKKKKAPAAMKTPIIIIFFSLLATGASAQTPFWSQMSHGNKSFAKKDYAAASDNYRRAQALRPEDARPTFNLGTSLLGQQDANAAMDTFSKAAEAASDPILRSMAHYNMGYIAQQSSLTSEPQQKPEYLKQAIEHYKNALRANPADDNARYNLALCQKLLKDAQQQQQQQNQQQQQQDQNKEQQDKQQQQQDQQQNQDQNQQQQQNQPEPNDQQRQDRDPQTQQLLNLSRQAEQRTRDRINASPRRQYRTDKDW